MYCCFKKKKKPSRAHFVFIFIESSETNGKMVFNSWTTISRLQLRNSVPHTPRPLWHFDSLKRARHQAYSSEQNTSTDFCFLWENDGYDRQPPKKDRRDLRFSISQRKFVIVVNDRPSLMPRESYNHLYSRCVYQWKTEHQTG